MGGAGGAGVGVGVGVIGGGWGEEHEMEERGGQGVWKRWKLTGIPPPPRAGSGVHGIAGRAGSPGMPESPGTPGRARGAGVGMPEAGRRWVERVRKRKSVSVIVKVGGGDNDIERMMGCVGGCK